MSSSRRATGEINILAMLDGRAPGRRLLARPAVVWYGAAGMLACSLLVALAWLVRGATPEQPTRNSQPAVAVKSAPAGRDTGDTRDSTSGALPDMRTTLPAEAPVPVPAPDTDASPLTSARGAVIIDLPSAAPALAATDAPTRLPAGMDATRLQPTAPRHPVAHAATPTAPSARPQPPFRTMPSQAPSLAHAEAAPPRQKRAAGASRTPPSASVDTDVALISAILQHTGTRNEVAGGAGTAACADKSCDPRLPSRQ
jgi:hypothetical protein